MKVAMNRIDRLMPALTFEERLDGLLAAYHENRRADRALLGTLPAADAARWNETADILNGLHTRLGSYVDLVEAFVTQIELRLALANVGRYLAGFLTYKRTEMEANAHQLSLAVVGELVDRWREVRLAELAAEHFGNQLGGRELLRAEVLAQLADCKARLQAMHADLADKDRMVVYEFELSEPAETSLEYLLDLLVDRGPIV